MAYKKSGKKHKSEQKKIAAERINILFKFADESALSGNLEDANSLIQQARKIAMKFNLKIPREYKRKFCKYCYRYLLPSITSQVRINSRNHRVEVKCLKCNRSAFHTFTREMKKKKIGVKGENEGKDKDVAHRENRDNRKRSRRNQNPAEEPQNP